MTHDELVQKLTPSLTHTVYFEFGAIPILNALRAVVELHKPDMRGNCDVCTWITNGGLVVYPCPTIQAIEKELE
jgi:hypothetical protein